MPNDLKDTNQAIFSIGDFKKENSVNELSEDPKQEDVDVEAITGLSDEQEFAKPPEETPEQITEVTPSFEDDQGPLSSLDFSESENEVVQKPHKTITDIIEANRNATDSPTEKPGMQDVDYDDKVSSIAQIFEDDLHKGVKTAHGNPTD